MGRRGGGSGGGDVIRAAVAAALLGRAPARQAVTLVGGVIISRNGHLLLLRLLRLLRLGAPWR